MKFNQALIAAVAASAMLMSPVFAQGPTFTCASVNREDVPLSTPAAPEDCGICVAGTCQMTADLSYICQTPDAVHECAPGPKFGLQCKAATHTEFGGECLETLAFKPAKEACDKESIKGKILKLDGSKNPECVCEHGSEKVTHGDSEVEQCKCAKAEEVRDATGACAPRVFFDCSSLKRNDPATGKAFSAKDCGECKVDKDCKSGTEDSYKCISSSDENGTQCNAVSKLMECKNASHVLKDGKCDIAPPAAPANETTQPTTQPTTEPTAPATTEPTAANVGEKPALTDEQKCVQEKHRQWNSNSTCGGCQTGFGSVTTEGDYMCFPHVTEDSCKGDKADKLHRTFDATNKLCICKPPMKAANDSTISSTTAACVNGAGQLVISSMVVLSSVLASALFFL